MAVRLARQEHLQAIERRLGRSIDGMRGNASSHIQRRVGEASRERAVNARLYRQTADWLAARGIAPDHFTWPRVHGLWDGAPSTTDIDRRHSQFGQPQLP